MRVGRVLKGNRNYIGMRTRRKSAQLGWKDVGRRMLLDKLEARKGE